MRLKESRHQAYLSQYRQYLHEEERSDNTIQAYLAGVKRFLLFLENRAINKAEMLDYKALLIKRYAPTSVNAMLAAVNGFLEWLSLSQYKVKPMKIQKKMFLSPEKELTQHEYQRLIQAAQLAGNERLSLIIQTICSTGIRVSELQYITVASLHSARANVSCKGKHRIILLPRTLCVALKQYCKAHRIMHGSVFITKGGKPINRSNVWKMMKKLCAVAQIKKSKVYPHNLRHLFAVTYYKMEKDIGRLADVLGHSNINTTRIYTMETEGLLAAQLNRMNLACCSAQDTT